MEDSELMHILHPEGWHPVLAEYYIQTDTTSIPLAGRSSTVEPLLWAMQEAVCSAELTLALPPLRTGSYCAV